MIQPRRSIEIECEPSRIESVVVQTRSYDAKSTFAQSSAATTAARRNAALPVSVFRKERSGVWRFRVHAVRPLNGAAETLVSAMRTSFANRVGSTEGREGRLARVRVPAGRPRAAPTSSIRGDSVADKSNGKNTGKIVEIKGVVLDAVFPDRLPEINHAVSIQVPERRRLARADRGGAAAPRRRSRPGRRHGHDRRARPRGRGRRHRAADLRAGRRPDARPDLERDRRPRRRQGGREGRALADPPRPAALRRPLADDRDLRDRHQGHRPDRAVRPRRQGRPLRRGRASARP